MCPFLQWGHVPFLTTLFVETPDEFPILIIRSKNSSRNGGYSKNCHMPANVILLRTVQRRKWYPMRTGNDPARKWERHGVWFPGFFFYFLFYLNWPKPETTHKKAVASKVWPNVTCRPGNKTRLLSWCRILSDWTDIIDSFAIFVSVKLLWNVMAI